MYLPIFELKTVQYFPVEVRVQDLHNLMIDQALSEVWRYNNEFSVLERFYSDYLCR